MLRYDSFIYVTKTASTSRTFYDDTVDPVRFRIFAQIVVGLGAQLHAGISSLIQSRTVLLWLNIYCH